MDMIIEALPYTEARTPPSRGILAATSSSWIRDRIPISWLSRTPCHVACSYQGKRNDRSWAMGTRASTRKLLKNGPHETRPPLRGLSTQTVSALPSVTGYFPESASCHLRGLEHEAYYSVPQLTYLLNYGVVVRIQ